MNATVASLEMPSSPGPSRGTKSAGHGREQWEDRSESELVRGRRTCAHAEFVIANETWLPHGQHHAEEVWSCTSDDRAWDSEWFGVDNNDYGY